MIGDERADELNVLMLGSIVALACNTEAVQRCLQPHGVICTVLSLPGVELCTTGRVEEAGTVYKMSETHTQSDIRKVPSESLSPTVACLYKAYKFRSWSLDRFDP